MQRFNNTRILLLLMGILLAVGLIMANRYRSTSTFRERILKAAYPVVMWLGKWSGKQGLELTHAPVNPPVSFYSLQTALNDGTTLDFSQLKGKYVLLVNTASSCGYTAQYETLQQLYDQYAGRLAIVGFPANDFGEQEKGSDAAIAAFCKRNYGVTFPIALKSQVLEGQNQHKVFRWLTDPAENGWSKQVPIWNFTKYLVDGEGRLVYILGPSVDPAKVASWIK